MLTDTEKFCISILDKTLEKANSLKSLGKYKEAAQSCKDILDTLESSSTEGLPENFEAGSKLHETLNKVVELLPELWRLAGDPHEAISSYRHALLHDWNLDADTTARIHKEFAIFLLYGGTDASPPNLRYQIEGSFIPENNIEEAVLLLVILLRSFALERIEWDPSIIYHLCYALSMSGALRCLADFIDELLPGVLDLKEACYILSLCYHGAGEDTDALNQLRQLLSGSANPNCIHPLLLASKICGETPSCAEEGVRFARRAQETSVGGCDQIGSVANCLLGVSLSAQARSIVSRSEMILKQAEALDALETAESTNKERDRKIIYHLCLENAQQRRMDVALYYGKQLLKLEDESDVKGWILMASILSAKRQFADAELIIDAALDQTVKWSQGELLRTKAKLQIAQGQPKRAIKTFSSILGILQVQNRSAGVPEYLLKGNRSHDRSYEQEIWHDLAKVYMSLSHWRDAEVCLSKSEEIAPDAASMWHTKGLFYEAKGLWKKALNAFERALDVEPTYVPSLISIANILRHQENNKSVAVARNFLKEALRLDRTNAFAWYSLGMLYRNKAKGCDAAATAATALLEAVECFEAASYLEESEPFKSFR